MTLRYQETGEVHLDFHRSANGTIAYLRDTYGHAFLEETLRCTAQNVYVAIRNALKAGDPEQLVEHWIYFFEREGGQYLLERKDDEIRFIVQRCPAIAYLKGRGIAIDRDFCRQTVVINDALAEGTPFEVTTEVMAGGKCVQTIRRRAGQ